MFPKHTTLMKVITLSEEKLNELAKEASERMLKGRSLNQGVIRGEELKDFSEHTQINKFLLFQVYQVWNLQLSKLKHPYFDFDQPEIEESLNNLRNQLSRNIAIKTADFGQMLQRAVYNNLKLLTAPKEAFESFFFVNGEKISLDLFERYTPFFADLDFVVGSILHYHKKNGLSTVEKDTFLEKMDRVLDLYNRKSDQDFDSYCADRIKQLTNKTVDDLLKISEEEQATRQAEEARKREEEAAREREEAEAARAEALRKEQEEQARKQAEEERLRKEEEARLKAEEEARKAAEEARQAAEALRKKEEELKRIEEERRKEEEKRQKQSFFDTLSDSGANYFDIDGDDQEEEPAMEAEPQAEPVAEIIEEVIEEAPVVQEIQEAPEVVEPTPDPVVETKPTEVIQEPEPIVEAEAEPEIEVETPEIVEEAPAVHEEDKPDTVAEKLVADLNEEKTVFERLKAQAEIKEEPEVSIVNSQETTETSEETDESQESTASFLDRFLNNKKEKTEEPAVVEETPPPAVEPESSAPSILDDQQDEERPQTVAEKFRQQTNDSASVVDHTLNGSNGKIKLDEIPIHKQYQYVQKVFDGNNVRFRIIVDKINNARGKEEVEDILNKFVLNNDSLDRGDGVVKEFLGLLRKRF